MSSSSSSSGTSLLDALNDLLGTGFVENGVNGAVNTAAWFVIDTIPTAVSLGHTLSAAAPAAAVSDVEPVAGVIEGGTMVNAVAPTGLGAAASVSLGEASAIGGLSVPVSWSSTAPATTLAAANTPLGGSGWTVASEAAQPVTAMPGMPGAAAAAKGVGAHGAGPRYGFKPVVMPKQTVV
ncbi:PPE family protein, SVP subgroup [Mycobacterium sp. M23085]|uniref:PPE family protein, SVP subgroup n=1 Tax=Mycobacterium sp. M23085 TaxID=3378087 RepID=UPI003877D54B